MCPSDGDVLKGCHQIFLFALEGHVGEISEDPQFVNLIGVVANHLVGRLVQRAEDGAHHLAFMAEQAFKE